MPKGNPEGYKKRKTLKDIDLQGALEIARRYYGGGESSPVRERSLKTKKKKKGLTVRTKAVDRRLEQAGVSGERFRRKK
jgi:hypothetical protein